MKRTVADLLGRGGVQEYAVETTDEPPGRQTVFTVGLVMNPAEVEILDGVLVWSTRVVASSHQGAVSKANIRVQAEF